MGGTAIKVEGHCKNFFGANEKLCPYFQIPSGAPATRYVSIQFLNVNSLHHSQDTKCMQAHKLEQNALGKGSGVAKKGIYAGDAQLLSSSIPRMVTRQNRERHKRDNGGGVVRGSILKTTK